MLWLGLSNCDTCGGGGIREREREGELRVPNEIYLEIYLERYLERYLRRVLWALLLHLHYPPPAAPLHSPAKSAACTCRRSLSVEHMPSPSGYLTRPHSP